MQCVIYARFSPTSRARAALTETIQVQTDACLRYATAQGWTVKGVFSDEKTSGGRLDRTGIDAALSAMSRGDVLLVHRLDRLFRDTAVAVAIQAAVKDLRGKIADTSRGVWGGTALHRLQINLETAIAQYQRESGSERTREAMRALQAKGRLISRQPPYGWGVRWETTRMPDGRPVVRGLLVEDSAEQAVRRLILELSEAGQGVAAIMRVLRERRIRARCGGPWGRTTIYKIINQRHVPEVES